LGAGLIREQRDAAVSIFVIPGCALVAQARNPYSLQGLEIPGSRFARPGMTKTEFPTRFSTTNSFSKQPILQTQLRILAAHFARVLL
jgi:hypothetical protein